MSGHEDIHSQRHIPARTENSLQDEEPQAEMEKVVYLSLPNLGIEMVK